MGGKAIGKILKLRAEAHDDLRIAADCLTAFVRGDEEDGDTDGRAFVGALLVAETIDLVRRLAKGAR